jgi:hypothetical protein
MLGDNESARPRLSGLHRSARSNARFDPVFRRGEGQKPEGIVSPQARPQAMDKTLRVDCVGPDTMLSPKASGSSSTNRRGWGCCNITTGGKPPRPRAK